MTNDDLAEVRRAAVVWLRSVEAVLGVLDHSEAVEEPQLVEVVSTKVVALVKQVEALRAELAELSSYQINYEHATKIEREEKNSDLATVKAERDAVLADKERLDWLEQQEVCFDWKLGPGITTGWTSFNPLTRKDTIREAIDAARKA